MPIEPDSKLKTRLQGAWYSGAWWLYLLVPLEWLYRGLVALRRCWYVRCGLGVQRACVPVVVVGNISAGGTGKTPAVLALVEALAARNIRAGVVSRGYGGKAPSYPYRVNARSTPDECGDEPLVIHQRTGVPCVVDPRRTRAVKMLEATGEVDIVLSDDGLSHYAMARDFEIVLYDEQAGFGNGRCLPAGPLREPVSRLGSADVVLARSQNASVSTLAIVPEVLVNLHTQERRALDAHGLGVSVVALAGIALPGLFFSQLEQLGFHIAPVLFPDHHVYTARDFAGLGDLPVIMTEKDAVKCRALAPENSWYLKTHARLPEQVVDQVAALLKPQRESIGTQSSRGTT